LIITKEKGEFSYEECEKGAIKGLYEKKGYMGDNGRPLLTSHKKRTM